MIKKLSSVFFLVMLFASVKVFANEYKVFSSPYEKSGKSGKIDLIFSVATIPEFKMKGIDTLVCSSSNGKAFNLRLGSKNKSFIVDGNSSNNIFPSLKLGIVIDNNLEAVLNFSAKIEKDIKIKNSKNVMASLTIVFNNSFLEKFNKIKIAANSLKTDQAITWIQSLTTSDDLSSVLNRHDEDGNTLLTLICLASFKNVQLSLDVLRVLLTQYQKLSSVKSNGVDYKLSNGMTPLQYCVFNKMSDDLIRFLIDNNAKLDVLWNGKSLPLLAVEAGKYSLAEFFMNKGIKDFDEFGNSIFHYLAKQDNDQAVTCALNLLNKGMFIKNNVQGESPLQFANNQRMKDFFENYNKSDIRSLISDFTNESISDVDLLKKINQFSNNKEIANVKDVQGRNLLHLTVLRKKKVDPIIINSSNVIDFKNQAKNVVAESLKDYKKIIDILWPICSDPAVIKDNDGNTPLHLAVQLNQGKLVKKYTENAVVSKSYDSSTYPIDQVEYYYPTSYVVVDFLLAHNPDLTLKNNIGKTVADIAEAVLMNLNVQKVVWNIYSRTGVKIYTDSGTKKLEVVAVKDSDMIASIKYYLAKK